MGKTRNIPRLWLFLAAAALLVFAGAAAADTKPRQGAELLLGTYHQNLARLETNGFGLPLFLESYEQADRVHVDVYGIFAYPFNSIVAALKVPANWCDIVFLHPNIKACTSRELPGGGLLTFYVGKKVYQPPEDARQVVYSYRVVKQLPGYLDIVLSADKGPFGTVDHHMRFEALPLDGEKTFVHVSYEYSDTMALRLAGKIYFATLGLDKVGFTVTGTDKNGNATHIGGPRGAIERNAVRYYLAIQTFMKTLRYPEKQIFSMRINEWYDHTTPYRLQLFDLDKIAYLANKSIEQKNQARLQRLVGADPGKDLRKPPR